MRKERGITLISLIIYMIVLTIVIATLAMISDLFFTNANYIKQNSKYVSEYNKFNMYFLEDVKNNRDYNDVTESEIVFEDGTVYTYVGGTDRSIYRNKVKICSNIDSCNFLSTKLTVNGVQKKIIRVWMIIEGSEQVFENEYVLKYW